MENNTHWEVTYRAMRAQLPHYDQLNSKQQFFSKRLLYDAVFNSPPRHGQTELITVSALKAKRSGSGQITKDHVYRPELFADIIYRNPELLDDFDRFCAIADQLTLVVLVLTSDNSGVLKEDNGTHLTRYHYKRAGLELAVRPNDTNRWAKAVPTGIPELPVPDFMHELELLGGRL